MWLISPTIPFFSFFFFLDLNSWVVEENREGNREEGLKFLDFFFCFCLLLVAWFLDLAFLGFSVVGKANQLFCGFCFWWFTTFGWIFLFILISTIFNFVRLYFVVASFFFFFFAFLGRFVLHEIGWCEFGFVSVDTFFFFFLDLNSQCCWCFKKKLFSKT
jgi:hypothetical protein